ncbi:hypothetical protein Tsp_09413 [Trichinella spiralis]|uniref:hypothetical protein n=1 Tax=Trichinella spiralis TaxID=6334 RepID=UPI0001EFD340|nr:hypothetical protein Tsp_09413 [Trichinella spiralis]
MPNHDATSNSEQKFNREIAKTQISIEINSTPFEASYRCGCRTVMWARLCSSVVNVVGGVVATTATTAGVGDVAVGVVLSLVGATFTKCALPRTAAPGCALTRTPRPLLLLGKFETWLLLFVWIVAFTFGFVTATLLFGLFVAAEADIFAAVGFLNGTSIKNAKN